MPVRPLDKSPLKLSHQSQKKQTVETSVVSKSLNSYPFQVANGLAASSTDCRQIQNRKPETTEINHTTTDFRFGLCPLARSSHTQDRQHRLQLSCPGFRIRLAIRSPHDVDKLMWQTGLCESSSVQLRHLLDNLVE